MLMRPYYWRALQASYGAFSSASVGGATEDALCEKHRILPT